MMPKHGQTLKEATSLRLTPEAKRLMRLLADRNGLSQSAWLETLIRREWERQGIAVSGGQAPWRG